MSQQDRYLPRDAVALASRIRSLLGAVKSAKEHAERANQDPAFSDLENAEEDLRSALARVIA